MKVCRECGQQMEQLSQCSRHEDCFASSCYCDNCNPDKCPGCGMVDCMLMPICSKDDCYVREACQACKSDEYPDSGDECDLCKQDFCAKHVVSGWGGRRYFTVCVDCVDILIEERNKSL